MSNFIIKAKHDEKYVCQLDMLQNKGYAFTHNKTSALKFQFKKEAKNAIKQNWLELHLMSDFIIENLNN